MAYKTTSKQSVANTGVTASSNITTSPPPVISQVYYTDSAYNVITATAAGTTTGGYLKLVGTGFQYGATVYLNGLATTVLSTTVVSSTEIRVRIAALTSGTYSLMLFNPNNTGAIYANGIVYSAEPVWTTTSYGNTFDSSTLNIQLAATGDAPLTYSLQSGSSLPAGVSMSSTGLISGTAGNISTDTTVTFTVVVSDLQNQTTSQLITLTMTFYFGKLWSWGGEPTINNGAYRSSPTQIGSEVKWASIAAIEGVATAIKRDGTFWIWGKPTNGRLGLNNISTYVNTPAQLGVLTNWKDSASGSGGRSILAIKTDGTLWTWGQNIQGDLGDGTTLSRSSPVQIGLLTDWSLISHGFGHSAVIKTNGTLWTWGLNSTGQLGDSTRLSKSSPIQVGALTNWLAISAAYAHTVAIKTNGTLWAWGKGDLGILGDGTTLSRSSPVQIGLLTDWQSIECGQQHTLAIKTGGTLWSWGADSGTGKLGLGTTTDRSSPVQIGALTNWKSVSAGWEFSTSIKTNGTLWTWGYNPSNSGVLGLGDTGINRSSPVQVGLLTNWIMTAAGNNFNLAITT